MWDLPGPGLKPVSPALAGGLLTTAPPGKPPMLLLLCQFPRSPQKGWPVAPATPLGGVPACCAEAKAAAVFQLGRQAAINTR